MKKMSRRKTKVKFAKLIFVIVFLMPSELDFGYKLHKSLDGMEKVTLKINITKQLNILEKKIL